MRTVENMSDAERFFFDHAGFSYDPNTETPDQGKARAAHELMLAEHDAQERGFYVEWIIDADGCLGCMCGNAECDCCAGREHTTRLAVLYDEPGGEVLASLGGICGADADYRRVIEAELAIEALHGSDTSHLP